MLCWAPAIKLFSLLLHNCNFAVMNCKHLIHRLAAVWPSKESQPTGGELLEQACWAWIQSCASYASSLLSYLGFKISKTKTLWPRMPCGHICYVAMVGLTPLCLVFILKKRGITNQKPRAKREMCSFIWHSGEGSHRDTGMATEVYLLFMLNLCYKAILFFSVGDVSENSHLKTMSASCLSGQQIKQAYDK